MATKKLFTSLTLGGKNPQTLSHRVVMAPLTRLKADADGVQPDMAATYYAQRATEGGLIIAEATNISETARGYFGAPGIFSDKQVEAWKKVTDGVHEKNGKIFLQLWHVGRVSHPLNQPNGQLPVSSSANMDITTGQLIPTPEGRKTHVAPRALETDEIPLIVQDYKVAAKNALAAGFDGVEFHCANGYLLEQFLQDGINDRTDKYGGSVENRARFLFEALDAILEVVDSSRVGIRLSPFGMSFGQCDSNPIETYGYVFKKLSDYDLAYAHLVEPRAFPLHESPNAPKDGIAHIFRPLYKGVLMTASGYDRESSIKVVEDGDADLVAIGRNFISNPDLVKRFKLDAPLNPYDYKTFYLPGAEGYIDHPFLNDN
jgi:N-ethylmaleimide reductase